MKNNYYIQKGTDQAVDIFSTYGIYVKETKGLNLLPKIKKPFIRDWPDEQGDDAYLPTNTVYESKEVSITFFIQKNTVGDIKASLTSFLQYVTTGGNIQYFDTYKKEGFRGYYNKNKINNETYRDYGSYIEFELEFVCPNGICFGFDNSGFLSLTATVTSGTADFYFSDGTSNLNVTNDFIKYMVGGFVIICPSVYGGISIVENKRKVLGINGKVLGINGKVLGI